MKIVERVTANGCELYPSVGKVPGSRLIVADPNQLQIW